MDAIKEYAENLTFAMELTVEPVKFVELEILLRLAERIGELGQADRLYMLLSRRDIIYEPNLSEADFLIGNARQMLKTMSHAKVYHDTLQQYSEASNNRHALYRLADNRVERNPAMAGTYDIRVSHYDALLDGSVKTERKSGKTRAGYEDTYVARLGTDHIVHLQFEKLPAATETIWKRERKGGPVCVSMEALLQAADALDEAEGKKYRRRILEGNIYEAATGEKIPATSCRVSGVTNLAGQVGAGKSTYADSLTAASVKQGWRVLLFMETVDAVLEKAELFEKAGFDVCALVGNSGRCDHADNQLRGRDYVPAYASKVLQQPCLLNARITKTEDLFKYGKEPCTSLRKMKKAHGGTIGKTTYTCPYYPICPKTENERRLLHAQIVVTTARGACTCTFGEKKESFFEYALKNFDMVIIDEVDRVVCQLDDIFAPTLAVDELLKDTREFRDSYKNSTLKERAEKGSEQQDLILFLDRLSQLVVTIYSDILHDKTGWKRYELQRFSAYTLLVKLKEKISEVLWDALYSLLSPTGGYGHRRNRRQQELFRIVEGESQNQNAGIIRKLAEIASAEAAAKAAKKEGSTDASVDAIVREIYALEESLRTKILFVVREIVFEQCYRELSELVERMEEVPGALRKITSRVLRIPQLYMPSAPIGNAFAIEVRDEDVYITKQFALGRAFALRMPYLCLDKEGTPVGPNVLLMSGTGYMPDSMRFHVGDQVDYVIEAEKEKREYIAHTRVVDMHCAVRVSGADMEKKPEQLSALIAENETLIQTCVQRGEKLLLIVNSYDQCVTACRAVNKLLMRSHIEDYQAWYLEQDNRKHQLDDANNLHRRDIAGFRGEMLIAPACVIERGYNIVDSLGNAWFDSVMFLVRPLVPNVYEIQSQNVNGYIMQHYTENAYNARTDVEEQIRKEAYGLYAVQNRSYDKGLADMPEQMKTDVIASLFVVIEQVFGRLCRIGSGKEKYPTIYWLDGAFHTGKSDGFDTIEKLKKYLEYLLNESKNCMVAKTLYEPFYLALKGADER